MNVHYLSRRKQSHRNDKDQAIYYLAQDYIRHYRMYLEYKRAEFPKAFRALSFAHWQLAKEYIRLARAARRRVYSTP